VVQLSAGSVVLISHLFHTGFDGIVQRLLVSLRNNN
jgi:hypothetical protein